MNKRKTHASNQERNSTPPDQCALRPIPVWPTVPLPWTTTHNAALYRANVLFGDTTDTARTSYDRRFHCSTAIKQLSLTNTHPSARLSLDIRSRTSSVCDRSVQQSARLRQSPMLIYFTRNVPRLDFKPRAIPAVEEKPVGIPAENPHSMAILIRTRTPDPDISDAYKVYRLPVKQKKRRKNK